MRSSSSSRNARSLVDLPETIQSQILSSFCDGRSASAYVHALSSSRSSRDAAFSVARDFLVDRLRRLARKERAGSEARDVIDVVREDARTCAFRSTEEGAWCETMDGVVAPAATRISEWCAVVDYFERTTIKVITAQAEITFDADEDDVVRRDRVLWCGDLSAYGVPVGRFRLQCPADRWTVTAMVHFRDVLELHSLGALVNPLSASPSDLELEVFGYLFPVDLEERENAGSFQQIQHYLSSDPESARFLLVPSATEYEPTVGISVDLERYGLFRTPSDLVCWWAESCECVDFEHALSRFADNAIQIMSMMDG